MKTMVNDFSYRNEHYTIVFDGKFYMTVNHKLIGNDGHPVRELNYTDGLHTNETLDGCIEDTKRDLDIKHLIAEGYSKKEAFAKIFNLDIQMLNGITF